MNRPFQIAIDGPVAAGKGSVSVKLAKALGFLYVDTGAMYRVAALLAIRSHIPFDDESSLVKEVQQHTIEMHQPTADEQDGRLTTILLDSKDVSWDIRQEAIGLGASRVAVLPKLRAYLVQEQQRIAAKHNVVMEGRDIAVRVLPQAQLKIYLDAALSERVKRKVAQLQALGQSISAAKVRQNIIDRDTREMTRTIDPLKPVADAWVLDSTHLSIDEVVQQIKQRVEQVQQATEGK